MQRYLIRRLLLAIPTLLGITIVVFMAVRFLPGDVIDTLLEGGGGASPEQRQALVEQYDLGGSVVSQYFEWMGDILTGDFGISIISGRSVMEDIEQRLPRTLQLGVMAMVVSLLIAIPVGIISAIRQNTIIDYLARSLAIGFLAIPSFWLALLAITYGFIWFGWTPPIRYEELWDSPVENLKILWLPSLLLGTVLSGSVMRFTRSTMLEVLRQDYVRTAWAKGLRERVIIIRHCLRNAFIPVITVIGLQIPLMVGGTVILESIFSIPGMGNYLLTALGRRDYPVVQAIVLLSAITVVAANLVVDLSYSLLDPRIRYS